ncbi:MAG: carboxypeptidase regulatory-like domain-containing protein [Deltaproteobacteria bacterium]|nr:carboxypeptidase regulatory-like domain-containing protein [Deltaproteobacteria bacterium]
MDRLSSLSLLALLLFAPPAYAGTVSGEVVGFPDGAPLAGVTVFARDPQGAAATSVTGADGTFVIEGVDPGIVRVRATPPESMNRIGAYAGDVSAFCAAATFDLESEGEVPGVVIELPVGGVVQGVLRDEEGVATPGSVRAQGVDTLNQSLSRATTADGSGAFAIAGLASWVDAQGSVVPGAYRLSAQLDGEPSFYWPGTWDLADAEPVPAVRGETTPMDLDRPVGARLLDGVVQDPQGLPVLGAEVAVLAGGFGVVWSTSTDAAGAWSSPEVPGADLRVRVRADGFAESWLGLETTGAGPLEAATFGGGADHVLSPMRLLTARALSLQVRAGEDVDASALLTLRRPEGTTLRSVVLSIASSQSAVEGLPPGDLVGLLSVSGWRPVELDIPQETTAADVSLAPQREAVAVVWDRATGLPVRGAEVRAHDPETTEALVSGRTDGEGRVTLDDVGPAAVFLSASWEPFCPADPARVTVWSGGARSEMDAATVPGDSAAEVRFAMPPDADSDAMDDVWELFWGLDPTRNDGSLDSDADGVTNLEEYRSHGDPRAVGGTKGCSQSGSDPTSPASALLVLALVLVPGVVGRGAGR